MNYKYDGDIYGNNRADRSCSGNAGMLALAVAAVPMQKWRLTYSPEKALCTGTMFAELNLPFKGGKCR